MATVPAKPDSAIKVEPLRTAPSGVVAEQATATLPVAPAAQPGTQAQAQPGTQAQAQPGTQPLQSIAAPVVAAAPASAQPAPRTVLPVERDFAPTDSDSERLAQQAAGRVPLHRNPPIFPRDAIRQGVAEGSVRARLTIAADGSVERVETSVADVRHAVFERSARAALMTWVFVPGAAGRVHETVLNFRAP
jgi:protein TonB